MFATTDLSDDHPDVQVMDSVLTSFGGRAAFSGPVRTVQVHEDNVLVVDLIQSCDPGTVVVVDGGASLRCALLGDRVAGVAVERGIAGIVINGCVRDREELAALDIGVLALASSPRRSRKHGEGQVDVDVTFANATFRTGDVLYADPDGVIVATDTLT